MKRILVGALAGIGALVILLVVIVLAVGGLAWTRTGTVPARTILEVNFTHGFQEQTPDDPVTGLLLANALVTAAGMRQLATTEPRAFDPHGLTSHIAEAEGWTFGVL